MALSRLASRDAAVQERHETTHCNRKWESARAHVNQFNGSKRTYRTGPRGGKVESTVYKDWVAANGGEWVGFQWRKNASS